MAVTQSATVASKKPKEVKNVQPSTSKMNGVMPTSVASIAPGSGPIITPNKPITSVAAFNASQGRTPTVTPLTGSTPPAGATQNANGGFNQFMAGVQRSDGLTQKPAGLAALVGANPSLAGTGIPKSNVAVNIGTDLRAAVMAAGANPDLVPPQTTTSNQGYSSFDDMTRTMQIASDSAIGGVPGSVVPSDFQTNPAVTPVTPTVVAAAPTATVTTGDSFSNTPQNEFSTPADSFTKGGTPTVAGAGVNMSGADVANYQGLNTVRSLADRMAATGFGLSADEQSFVDATLMQAAGLAGGIESNSVDANGQPLLEELRPGMIAQDKYGAARGIRSELVTKLMANGARSPQEVAAIMAQSGAGFLTVDEIKLVFPYANDAGLNQQTGGQNQPYDIGFEWQNGADGGKVYPGGNRIISGFYIDANGGYRPINTASLAPKQTYTSGGGNGNKQSQVVPTTNEPAIIGQDTTNGGNTSNGLAGIWDTGRQTQGKG
jgi:hypothetical protein